MRTVSLIAALMTAGVVSAHAQTADTLPSPTAPGQAPGVEETVEQLRDEKAENGTIADFVKTDGRFTTLARAVEAAGLGETLMGSGPYTIFAPTDDAFAAQPQDDVEAWMKPANKEKLGSVLEYHVVAGKIRSQDIPIGVTKVPTLAGATLKIERSESGITVNGARIAEADIEATNGTVHAIDQVLMPQAAAVN